MADSTGVNVIKGTALAAVALAGCAGPRLPAAHYPPPQGPPDARTALAPPRPVPPRDPKAPPFEPPPTLPGAEAPPVVVPRFDKDTPQADREAAVRKAFPAVAPVAAAEPPAGAPLTLADLRALAATNSPAVRRAAADADAALGQVIQAGLHPNPTVGYQADQVQPALRPAAGGGAGQHGGFVNQLIKTAGKLKLAQQVAGFDYVNALVAVRRAEADAAAVVRAQYFAVLVARQAVVVNRALVELADESYRFQLARAAAGQAAGYEPLQAHAQAEQARNALAQAEATHRGAWRQLAAAVGRPDLPPAALAGTAESPPPAFDADRLLAWVRDQHTDVLTARNAHAQAQANVLLQRRAAVPDVTTNQYHQYDNLAQTYQFGVQLGVQLPLSDRNQGNVRTAEARVVRAAADLEATQESLTGRVAEAFARYEAGRSAAGRYRDAILPSLTRAYRAMARRHQTEPDAVTFDDLAKVQQDLGQALQTYLTALDAQWRAVVDLAALGQLDDLFPPE